MASHRKRLLHSSSPNISIESITDGDVTSSPVTKTWDSQGSRGGSSIKGVIEQFEGRQRNVRTKRRRIKAENGVEKTTASPILWYEKYRPTKSTEICVHKQKLTQVKRELDQMLSGDPGSRVLILSGPSGSGKSTVARILAQEAHKDVLEFSTRTTSTSWLSSSVTQFSEFLDQCKLLGRSNKCIIVEELPNVYHSDTLDNFRRALMDWIELDSQVKLPGLVLCVTEFDCENAQPGFILENVFKVETLLGRRLLELENRGFRRVKFNPVAKTFLGKALRRVIESRKEFAAIPKAVIKKEVDELAQIGDLRNALITLEYWARYLPHESSSERILGKENGLTIFHSIGKIVYGTQHPQEEYTNYMKTANLVRLYAGQSQPSLKDLNSLSVENVAQDAPSSLAANILENYLVIGPGINWDLARLTDLLSQYDTLMTPLMTYYMCFGSRVLCEKLKKSSSSSARIRYSRESKVRNKRNSILGRARGFERRRCDRLLVKGEYAHLSNRETILIDGFYLSQIMGSKRAENRAVPRLGGDFNDIILADTEFKPEVEESLEEYEKRYFGEVPVEIGDEEFDEDPIVDSESDSSADFSDDSLVRRL